MKKFDIVITLIGAYLFVLGILAIVNSIIHPEIANFLWLCYISLLVIGLGMLLRNSRLITLQLNIIFLPILVWNVDFFYRLLSGEQLWGITEYLFEGGLNSLGNFITLQHIYILPLAIYTIYKLGLRSKKIWIFSFVEIITLFVLGVLFTPVESNTNCIFSSCVNFITITGIQYQIVWFVGIFAMIFGVNYGLVRLFFKD